MYVGDVRTGADSIGPLEGATFGLFPANPAADINHHDGFTEEEPLYECTSDANGWCTFTVSVDEQLPQSRRLWLAATGAPGNRYANPQWQTGPLSPNQRDPLRSLRHVFQTPVLEAGQTYASYGPNRNWITDPGLLTDPAIVTPGAMTTGGQVVANNYQRRVASGGVFPLSDNDPELPAQCGLKAALVVDLSSSVSGYVDDIKRALDNFVLALRGTPSQAALFTFGTDSPANGNYGQNTSLLPVATTANNKAFRDRYAGWGNPPTNYTNWDRGLGAVADANATHPEDQRFDMAVVLTDGNPTVYGPNPAPNNSLRDRNSGYTRFRELGNANASANLLKSQGTRIMAVGVGSGVDGVDAGYNLRTISGRDPYTGDNIREADYLQTENYAAAGAALRDLMLDSCAPSVSVVKQIVPYDDPDDGTLDEPYTPAEPWEFTARPTGDATVQPTTATTDPQTGALNFDMSFTTGPQGLHVAETPQSGYQPLPGYTRCVNKTTGDDVPVEPVPDPDNPGAFTVDVGLDDAISCTVYNRAPDLDAASVKVHKKWEVTTTTGPNGETTTTEYPHGDQPAGLEATAGLDGPGAAESSYQPWDQARDGYDVADDGSVNVTENVNLVPEGCELTGSDIDGTPMTPGSPANMALRPGDNEWTITNRVECHSRLRLHKEVGSGDGDPSWWQLRAHGPDGALPGPQGRDTTDWADVTPGGVYQLAEQADPPGGDVPHDVLHYVQNDQRTRPLQFPRSTGSWSCHHPDGGGAFSTDVEGGIAVPLGEDVECTAVNQTAFLNVVKHVEGGDAKPGDFTFRLDPVEPITPGGHGHDVTGGAEPGTQQTVQPRQNYTITESRGPTGYRLTDLTCRSGEQTLSPEEFALEPGGTGTCVATNRRMSELTVEKRDAGDQSLLPGAEFELYRDTDGDGAAGVSDDAPDPGDTKAGSCTSDDRGRCAIGALDFGDYYWFERNAPEGYLLPGDRTSEIVRIDENNAGEPHTTTFADPRAPTPPDPTEPTPPPEPTDPPGSTSPTAPEAPGTPGGPGGPDQPGGPDGNDGAGQGELPNTGVDIGVPLAIGVLFLLAGSALIAHTRKRSSR